MNKTIIDRKVTEISVHVTGEARGTAGGLRVVEARSGAVVLVHWRGSPR